MSAYTKKLTNALQGNSKSKNGLNLPELKEELSILFPQDSLEIKTSSRKELQHKYTFRYDSEIITPINKGKSKYNNKITKEFQRNMYKLVLPYSSYSGYKEMTTKTLETYLKEGANPDTISRTSHDTRVPALFLLIKNGSDKLLKNIKLLLEYGADPNQKIDNGYDIVAHYYIGGDSPLHTTIKFCNYPLEIVKLLVEYGADPYIEDNNGLNAFDTLEMVYGKNSSASLYTFTKKKNNNICIKIHTILETGYGKKIKGVRFY